MESKKRLEDSETMRPVTESFDGDDEYSLPELIVSTAYMRVYKVRSSDKMLCIKTPAKDSGLLIELLKREYAIGASLSHPFIASYLRWTAESPVGPGIVMEYVDGCSLDEFLSENKSRQIRHRIFEQLLDAAEYLHDSGIVHNDLKPGNILVNRVNRSLKLIDFGFSDNDANTWRRALGGTVGYASPELLQGALDADARSDIYSLGKLMRDIYGRRFRCISRRCLKSDPNKRYRTVSDLRKAWRRARYMPRAIAFLVFAILLTASVLWNISIARHSADASADAASRVELLNDSIRKREAERRDEEGARVALLNDSISKLNSEIRELNDYVDDINLKEQHRAKLADLYTRGADSLANAVEARMRGCSDKVELLTQLGAYHETFSEYDKKFLKEHPDGGAEIVDRMSASVMNKTYERLKASYDRLSARISATGLKTD